MRGLDPNDRRARLAARACLLLLALATAGAGPPDGPATANAPDEPIDLCAGRILAWEAGGRRWAILDGEASVLQGAFGVRAPIAVVRTTPEPGPDAAKGACVVEIYAEGGVRDVAEKVRTAGRWRRTLRTTAGVRAGTHDGATARGLTGPPASAIGLLARAFPEGKAATIAAVARRDARLEARTGHPPRPGARRRVRRRRGRPAPAGAPEPRPGRRTRARRARRRGVRRPAAAGRAAPGRGPRGTPPGCRPWNPCPTPCRNWTRCRARSSRPRPRAPRSRSSRTRSCPAPSA